MSETQLLIVYELNGLHELMQCCNDPLAWVTTCQYKL